LKHQALKKLFKIKKISVKEDICYKVHMLRCFNLSTRAAERKEVLFCFFFKLGFCSRSVFSIKLRTIAGPYQQSHVSAQQLRFFLFKDFAEFLIFYENSFFAPKRGY
jgi:hypothetical protein